MAAAAVSEMDRWRRYFAKAGTDIWTIIQQAITIGAIDFPMDFRERRGEIAETLFARNLNPLHPLKIASPENRETAGGDKSMTKRTANDRGKDDATRLKSSVICKNDTDGAEYRHQDGKTFSDEAELVIRHVNVIKASIRNVDQPENVMVETLERLKYLQITVGALKATEIGKEVTILKRHPARRVRVLAKELVRGWKILVDEWASNAIDGAADFVEPGCSYCPKAPVKEGRMELPLINEVLEQAEAPTTEVSKLCCFMNDEICTQNKNGLRHPVSVEASVKDNSKHLSRSLSGSTLTDSSDFDMKASTNHCWGHATPEERGSTTCDVYLSYGNVEKKTSSLIGQTTHQPKMYRDLDNRCVLKSSKGMPSVINPGQSWNETEKTVRLTLGGKQVNCHSSVHETRIAQKAVAVPSSNAAYVYSLKSEKNEVEKLQIAKRKLRQGYQQAENAKKQHTVQVLNYRRG